MPRKKKRERSDCESTQITPDRKNINSVSVSRKLLSVASVFFSGRKLGLVFTRQPKLIDPNDFRNKDIESLLGDPGFVVKEVIQ